MSEALVPKFIFKKVELKKIRKKINRKYSLLNENVYIANRVTSTHSVLVSILFNQEMM